MHNKNDLKEMDLEQLRSIAGGLEVKGYKRLEKDDLVYAILDHEAMINAKNAPEKPEKKRGRGRPKKEKPADPIVDHFNFQSYFRGTYQRRTDGAV